MPVILLGSIAAKSLRVLDRIIKNTGIVSLIVERPVERPAVELMESALTASLQQPPSVTMPSDVKSIVRRQSMKISNTADEIQPVKVLKRQDDVPKYYPHVQIEDHMNNEFLIGMNKEKATRLHKAEILEGTAEEKESFKTKQKNL
uniref:Uncharacterized protein n=1 Tax=Angiostrongylus cantonensis TaxID=6313 RepID=A0A0K0DA56_ANGCA